MCVAEDQAVAGRGVHQVRRAARTIVMAVMLAGSHGVLGADSVRDALRVCADPHNLPMSNEAGEGYENKIAELFANKLGLPLEYEWFPQRIGFIRNTLRDNDTEDGRYKCDLVMGVIENFEIAMPTRPYMRSSWAMVYVKGRGLDHIQSQDDLRQLTDEQVKQLRIGAWDRGPGTDFIYQAGLMEQAIPYQAMSGDARENPGKIVERDLINDTINLTFVWGPIAGYYQKATTDHELVVIPMRGEPGIRVDFQIAMAVRFGDKAWRNEVNQLIADNQTEIDAILTDFGVPLKPLRIREIPDDDD